MNELARANATRMSNIVAKHNLSYNTYEIETGDIVLNKTGTYLIFGSDNNQIANMKLLDADRFYEEAVYQEKNNGMIYPRCNIVKIEANQPLLQYSKILDNILVSEFISEKCKEYGLKVPHECEYQMALTAYDYYKDSINPDYTIELRSFYKSEFEDALKFISSGKTIEEYYGQPKEKKKNIPQFKYETAKKYISKEENNVPLDELICVGRNIATSNITEKNLFKFEEQIKRLGPDIKYHIKEDGFVVDNYGEYQANGNEYNPFKNSKTGHVYHTVSFDDADEYIVSSVINRIEYEELNKHAKFLSYEPGSKYCGVSLPIYDFDEFLQVAEKFNLKYYFDANGAYIPSTLYSAGILVDNNGDLEKLHEAIEYMYKSKREWHLIDKEAEKIYYAEISRFNEER